jgi:hypothetical protein
MRGPFWLPATVCLYMSNDHLTHAIPHTRHPVITAWHPCILSPDLVNSKLFCGVPLSTVREMILDAAEVLQVQASTLATGPQSFSFTNLLFDVRMS